MFTSSHMHMLICTIITSLCILQPEIQANACLCLPVLPVCIVLCSPHAWLLTWHLEPVVTKVMSVQVCSESTSHAGAVQMTHDPQQVEHCKLVDLLS